MGIYGPETQRGACRQSSEFNIFTSEIVREEVTLHLQSSHSRYVSSHVVLELC